MRQSISQLRLVGVFAAALLACAGCQFVHYSEHTLNAPGEQASETDAPRVTVEMGNSAKMRAVPLQVQHAFALDYNDAAVTSVHMVPLGGGMMNYEISYIENGTPGLAVYHADGASAAASEGVVIRPEISEVPIKPLPPDAPATQPVGRDYQ